jgi:cytochrome P450
MARQLTCRICGELFDVPDPSERRQGRLPHYCSAECKREGKRRYNAIWNPANAWRYRRPADLIDLMRDPRRARARGFGR